MTSLGAWGTAKGRSSLAQKLRSSFSPWQAPSSPPAGTYDPALDAQYRAAQRGFGDLQQDTERDVSRLGTQYSQATGDAQSGTDMSLADVLRQRQRATVDFGQARDRSNQDFATSTQNMRQGYERQGIGQQERATSAGLAQGGTLAAAMQARLANQGHDQGALNQQHDRSLADIGQQQARFTEDSTTQESRLRDALAKTLGRLGEGYTQQGDDAATAQARAGRELGFFGQDTAAQRFFQATQSGQYTMPGRGEPGGPASNEFRDAQGAYKVIMRGGRKIRVNPNGTPRR